jgi:cytidylate kinase
VYKSIVICGKIASGTSTSAKNVANKLNLKYESAGDFFRKYVLENNIPLHDKSQIPDELDQKIDKKLTNLAKNGGYVIDAHYLGYFCRQFTQVLKVLLVCNDKERIKRAVARKHTHTETVDQIKKREQSHIDKFQKLYSKENYENPKFFDLVIDTAKTDQKTTAQNILEKFNS